jgi:hypothetical protein
MEESITFPDSSAFLLLDSYYLFNDITKQARSKRVQDLLLVMYSNVTIRILEVECCNIDSIIVYAKHRKRPMLLTS